jgi:hypothetical protein
VGKEIEMTYTYARTPTDESHHNTHRLGRGRVIHLDDPWPSPQHDLRERGDWTFTLSFAFVMLATLGLAAFDAAANLLFAY